MYSKSKGLMVAYPALKASMTPGPTLRRPRSPLRTRRRYDSVAAYSSTIFGVSSFDPSSTTTHSAGVSV
jgi:hypothetical protein